MNACAGWPGSSRQSRVASLSRRDDVGLVAGGAGGNADRVGQQGADDGVSPGHLGQRAFVGHLREETAFVEAPEVQLRLGQQGDGLPPALDAIEGAHQPLQGVVAVRDGAVAGGALGPQSEPERPFLADGAVEDRSAHAEQLFRAVAALVQDVLGVHDLRVVLVHPVDAGVAPRLFIRQGQEDHVSVQGDAVALEEQERHELHDRHALHVQRAPSPDDAVADSAGEGRLLPKGRLGGHHVGVVEEDEGLPTAVAGQAGLPRRQEGREVGAAGGRLVEARLQALAAEDACEEEGRRLLVARRVGGVDGDVAGEEVCGLLRDLLPVDSRLPSGHAHALPTPAGPRAGRRGPSRAR